MKIIRFSQTNNPETEYVTVNLNGEEVPAEVTSPEPSSSPKPTTGLDPNEAITLNQFIHEKATGRASHPVREAIHIEAEIIEKEATIAAYGFAEVLCSNRVVDDAVKAITPYLQKLRDDLDKSNDYTKQAFAAVCDLAIVALENLDERAKYWIGTAEYGIELSAFVERGAKYVADATKDDDEVLEGVSGLFETRPQLKA